jgi:hypothetical protein
MLCGPTKKEQLVSLVELLSFQEFTIFSKYHRNLSKKTDTSVDNLSTNKSLTILEAF